MDIAVVKTSDATAIRQMLAPESTKMHPIIRRIILEQFLAVRKNTAERVSETVAHPLVNVTTYMSYDAAGNMMCEDVVVSAR